MKLSDILTTDRIRLDFDAASKKRVLEFASELLAGSDENLSPRAVFDCLIAREKLGSTGLGHGVAIPHGRLAGLEKTIGVFIKVPKGVDFDAPDSEPVDLIFALLVPEQSTEEHLQVIAKLAGYFNSNASRDALRVERTPDKVRELICQADGQD
ncbi:MAG: PTS IIA-like nitrogen regulatory protein PtsN [Gammaproteobacteria bacterium]|nr:PTS IIA-like nitrogen regulatory protein PtsN [Gammaproteobacteria bacterium]NIM72203.1 PTS IIA-like nitrogen regulatory protein PtsN [Gammaproteobacteria bacterium]NIN39118.1 PTS IIA-like nitrogen regulatory protein PtsN [Gammaproteobacteria bacterium]NIO23951.1 PTS IIA-like nitrogen regulatory protein PtsN [Gammaproteobacteria bacterium]NIO64603.1 PTS IIA-like nitrogen regulatory protein PtsN [Gammaproteobacteria bacterium]